jgi:hypothetical protein
MELLGLGFILGVLAACVASVAIDLIEDARAARFERLWKERHP